MTQVWPGRGVAPVPTLRSVICSPDGVVTVFAASAVAMVDAPAETRAAKITVRRSIGIGGPFLKLRRVPIRPRACPRKRTPSSWPWIPAFLGMSGRCFLSARLGEAVQRRRILHQDAMTRRLVRRPFGEKVDQDGVVRLGVG